MRAGPDIEPRGQTAVASPRGLGLGDCVALLLGAALMAVSALWPGQTAEPPPDSASDLGR